MRTLQLGDKFAQVPIIQGGMGVGISRSKLAGAVAAEGGIGIISTAQIGYDEEGFLQNPRLCNLKAIEKHIKLAKAQAKNGLVGVNVMVALKDYAEHVKAAVKAGADVIISGAGLPVDLPELVEGSDTKIAPIVSSKKAASVILKMWDMHYHRTADFVVIEGPKAGGHLGFSEAELEDIQHIDYDERIKSIIETVRQYADKFKQKIPVIVAGGIFSKEDIDHVLTLGADGVQIASRFVATEECDAADSYKQAYVNAKQEDIEIIKSPVGMPGRAMHNAFLERVKTEKQRVKHCYQCLSTCNVKDTPYCITEALTQAVIGDVQNGLVFCGAEVGKIYEISTVHNIMEELKVSFC